MPGRSVIRFVRTAPAPSGKWRVCYCTFRPPPACAIRTMSQPYPRPTAAPRRVRGVLAVLVAVLGALPFSAWALRPVRVYEVDLDEQSPTAVQSAMRQALVRATGRRESADDPALAGVIADAAKYVKSYASGPRGEPQVVFDAAAVAHAIDTAGRSVWDRDRPFTLIVLHPPLGR